MSHALSLLPEGSGGGILESHGSEPTEGKEGRLGLAIALDLACELGKDGIWPRGLGTPPRHLWLLPPPTCTRKKLSAARRRAHRVWHELPVRANVAPRDSTASCKLTWINRHTRLPTRDWRCAATVLHSIERGWRLSAADIWHELAIGTNIAP